MCTWLQGSSKGHRRRLLLRHWSVLLSGLNPDIPAKASNPLRTVLDAIGERVECEKYETFGLKFPEGDFVHTTEFGRKGGVLETASGYAARYQWSSLMKRMQPL